MNYNFVHANNELLQNYGGESRNDLNAILNHVSEDEPSDILSLPKSFFVDIDNLVLYLKNISGKFSILTLNCQSLNAKHSQIALLMEHLKNNNVSISALCLQETWSHERDDMDIFNLPGYNLISQGKICCGHGGLAIYIHESFQAKKISNIYTSSIFYEALFVEIFSGGLDRKITIGNVYRPSRSNDNNTVIEQFNNEFLSLLTKIKRNHKNCVLVGDFNIDLIQINQRDKFGDFLDIMITNGFYPQISMPTRFSKKRASLIDQIYSNLNCSNNKESAILASAISDHFSCISAVCDITQSKEKYPKYITVQKRDEKSFLNFRNALIDSNLTDNMNTDISADPTENYNILYNKISSAIETHLPTKKSKI